ncbi:hypothetical protein SCOTTMCG_183 [Mycobacterium phage ScottMcG]|uniref:Uncharacterized protein n=1 Tax=Mycobacterium phage ScottMcG TaxID=546807 RepID=B5LLD1_9CAUD|nr:hypothetical protein SCOTTMCG_183 [Mycobacterium phage ScottMcG]ACH62828.1 hypothetical protein SCOTTMCG_183 [Mycobacterium phage ScottMcG]UEM46210.1 hypothetical protein SEA_PINKCREEK_173 [Mycobacterium phage Pinkcreek]
MSTLYIASAALDRDFADAVRKGEATGDQVRYARALIEVHAVDVSPYYGARQKDVRFALDVAAHLIASGKFVTTHQIRSLYPAGGLTYDLIRDLIAEVEEA